MKYTSLTTVEIESVLQAIEEQSHKNTKYTFEANNIAMFPYCAGYAQALGDIKKEIRLINELATPETETLKTGHNVLIKNITQQNDG